MVALAVFIKTFIGNHTISKNNSCSKGAIRIQLPEYSMTSSLSSDDIFTGTPLKAGSVVAPVTNTGCPGLLMTLFFVLFSSTTFFPATAKCSFHLPCLSFLYNFTRTTLFRHYKNFINISNMNQFRFHESNLG